MGTNEVLAIALKALKKGGGGGGGTSNYNNLTNLPQINGVTLQGNKTSDDLGITDLSALIAEEFDSAHSYAINDLVIYEGELYQFVKIHIASDPWDATEVSATTVTELIRKIHHMIADDFDETQNYDIGDLVIYESELYQFISPYVANSGWDASKVQSITIEDLIIAYIRDTKASLEGMIAEQFDDTKAYAVGDKVIYEDVLYKFTKPHAAGAWDATEAEPSNMTELVDEIVPLEQSQLDDLLGMI